MSVVAFVNGELGARALQLLGDRLTAVVLNSPQRARDTAALKSAAPGGLPILTGGDNAKLFEELSSLSPTHGISVLYAHILSPEILRLFPQGIANVHPSFLPYGRGVHPSAWAIVEGTPAGVSFHLLDEGVDSGPLLAQVEVPVDASMTAADLYSSLIKTAGAHMSTWFEAFLEGKLEPRPQPSGDHKTHRTRDLEDLLRVDPDKTYTGRELIDLLRARTFPRYPGALYEADGRQYRLSIQVQPDE